MENKEIKKSKKGKIIAIAIAAVVGTINLDYGSLYHHFENAAAFYHKDAVAGVKADFDHLFEECHEVTEQYRSHRSTALRIGQCILRLFAPLL